MSKLAELVKHARPLNDDDWGSDRQCDAEADLFEELTVQVPELAIYIEYKSVACKMTIDESLDFIQNELENNLEYWV